MSENGPTVVTQRFVAGVVIASIGIILMLDRVGLVDARLAFRLWPAVIVAGGAAIYFRGPDRAGRTNGAIVMGIGGWLLLSSLGVIRVSLWQLFWPLVLIALGTALVMQGLHKHAAGDSATSDRNAADWVTMIAVMSGVKRANASPRFRGGDLAAFMGGGRLDLRQATIPPGEEAVVDLLAMMGAYEIFVPTSWIVATPVIPFMASVEDHRLPALPGAGAPSSSAAPRLVLRGFIMMSSVHIRS